LNGLADVHRTVVALLAFLLVSGSENFRLGRSKNVVKHVGFTEAAGLLKLANLALLITLQEKFNGGTRIRTPSILRRIDTIETRRETTLHEYLGPKVGGGGRPVRQIEFLHPPVLDTMSISFVGCYTFTKKAVYNLKIWL
jgi:hypothetical protein